MNMANVYKNQGLYSKALETHEKSLKIKTKVLGHDHLVAAKAKVNIGSVYDDLGGYKKALKNS